MPCEYCINVIKKDIRKIWKFKTHIPFRLENKYKYPKNHYWRIK